MLGWINTQRLEFQAVHSLTQTKKHTNSKEEHEKQVKELAEKEKDSYWETAKTELIERGWVEDIRFKKNEIAVKGSIEASKGEEPTCHRLRGILRHLFEKHRGEKLFISEKKCTSMGDKACVFVIEPIE